MIPLLIGAVVALGTIAVVANWDEIVDFFKNLIQRIKQFVITAARKIASAATMTIKKIKNGCVKIMHNLFYKENGKWMEKTTVREVSEDEVPESIRRKVSAQEQDITAEMSRELEMEI